MGELSTFLIILLVVIIIVMVIYKPQTVDQSADAKTDIKENYKIKEQNLWPYPNKIEMGSGKLSVKYKLSSKNLPKPLRELFTPVIKDFNNFVFGKKIPNKTNDGFYNIIISNPSATHIAHNEESYILSVTNKGITIRSKNYIGAVRALTTLSQLIRYDEGFIIKNVGLLITDKPQYYYRSVMLDTTRHFLPVATILKMIRGMAFNKLNYLHLHLTDAQSFPLNIGPITNRLSIGKTDKFGNIGAYSKAEIYNKTDISKIVEYAKSYGIYVVPEVDTPGHTHSWKGGYEELMVCTDCESQRSKVCPEPSCGYLNIKPEAKGGKLSQTFKIIAAVWGETISAFKIGQPGYSDKVHLGLDEVSGLIGNMGPGKDGKEEDQSGSESCDKKGPTTDDYKGYLKKLFSYFEKTYSDIHPIIWADPILNFGFDATESFIAKNALGLYENMILHVWEIHANANAPTEIPDKLKILIELGYNWIMSDAVYYYLDSGGTGNSVSQGGPIIYNKPEGNTHLHTNNSTTSISYPKYWMRDYPQATNTPDKPKDKLINGRPGSGWRTSWQEIYLNNIRGVPVGVNWYDVKEIPDGNDSGKGKLLGAEVCCWGEIIDQYNLSDRLFPAASALAEVLWKNTIDNVIHATYRLTHHREDMLRMGITPAVVGAPSFFKNAPWGAAGTNDEKNNLMIDINENKQIIPDGNMLNFYFNWNPDQCNSLAINPTCVDQIYAAQHENAEWKNASYAICGDDKSGQYAQQGCGYNCDAKSMPTKL